MPHSKFEHVRRLGVEEIIPELQARNLSTVGDLSMLRKRLYQFEYRKVKRENVLEEIKKKTENDLKKSVPNGLKRPRSISDSSEERNEEAESSSEMGSPTPSKRRCNPKDNSKKVSASPSKWPLNSTDSNDSRCGMVKDGPKKGLLTALKRSLNSVKNDASKNGMVWDKSNEGFLIPLKLQSSTAVSTDRDGIVDGSKKGSPLNRPLLSVDCSDNRNEMAATDSNKDASNLLKQPLSAVVSGEDKDGSKEGSPLSLKQPFISLKNNNDRSRMVGNDDNEEARDPLKQPLGSTDSVDCRDGALADGSKKILTTPLKQPLNSVDSSDNKEKTSDDSNENASSLLKQALNLDSAKDKDAVPIMSSKEEVSNSVKRPLASVDNIDRRNGPIGGDSNESTAVPLKRSLHSVDSDKMDGMKGRNDSEGAFKTSKQSVNPVKNNDKRDGTGVLDSSEGALNLSKPPPNPVSKKERNEKKRGDLSEGGPNHSKQPPNPGKNKRDGMKRNDSSEVAKYPLKRSPNPVNNNDKRDDVSEDAFDSLMRCFNWVNNTDPRVVAKGDDSSESSPNLSKCENNGMDKSSSERESPSKWPLGLVDNVKRNEKTEGGFSKGSSSLSEQTVTSVNGLNDKDGKKFRVVSIAVGKKLLLRQENDSSVSDTNMPQIANSNEFEITPSMAPINQQPSRNGSANESTVQQPISNNSNKIVTPAVAPCVVRLIRIDEKSLAQYLKVESGSPKPSSSAGTKKSRGRKSFGKQPRSNNSVSQTLAFKPVDNDRFRIRIQNCTQKPARRLQSYIKKSRNILKNKFMKPPAASNGRKSLAQKQSKDRLCVETYVPKPSAISHIKNFDTSVSQFNDKIEACTLKPAAGPDTGSLEQSEVGFKNKATPMKSAGDRIRIRIQHCQKLPGEKRRSKGLINRSAAVNSKKANDTPVVTSPFVEPLKQLPRSKSPVRKTAASKPIKTAKIQNLSDVGKLPAQQPSNKSVDETIELNAKPADLDLLGNKNLSPHHPNGNASANEIPAQDLGRKSAGPQLCGSLVDATVTQESSNKVTETTTSGVSHAVGLKLVDEKLLTQQPSLGPETTTSGVSHAVGLKLVDEKLLTQQPSLGPVNKATAQQLTVTVSSTNSPNFEKLPTQSASNNVSVSKTSMPTPTGVKTAKTIFLSDVKKLLAQQSSGNCSTNKTNASKATNAKTTASSLLSEVERLLPQQPGIYQSENGIMTRKLTSAETSPLPHSPNVRKLAAEQPNRDRTVSKITSKPTDSKTIVCFDAPDIRKSDLLKPSNCSANKSTARKPPNVQMPANVKSLLQQLSSKCSVSESSVLKPTKADTAASLLSDSGKSPAQQPRSNCAVSKTTAPELVKTKPTASTLLPDAEKLLGPHFKNNHLKKNNDLPDSVISSINFSHSPNDGSGSENWQSRKCSLKERFAHLFHNASFSDVSFVVGYGQKRKRIRAHKVVLSAGSAVLAAMFENMASGVDEVVVLDVEPAAFFELLRYLYTDNVSINLENLTSVLYAAKKYDVPHLEKKCIDLWKSQLCPDNAFTFLTQARLLNEPKLISVCELTIDNYTAAALLHRSFLNIDLDTLCSILKRDTLSSSEVNLFDAVCRWSEAECKRKNLPVNQANQRTVLGDALSLVRYPLMSIVEFSSKVAMSGLLPKRDVIAMFHYLTADPKPPVRFNTKPRTLTIIEPFKIKQEFDESC